MENWPRIALKIVVAENYVAGFTFAGEESHRIDAELWRMKRAREESTGSAFCSVDQCPALWKLRLVDFAQNVADPKTATCERAGADNPGHQHCHSRHRIAGEYKNNQANENSLDCGSEGDLCLFDIQKAADA